MSAAMDSNKENINNAVANVAFKQRVSKKKEAKCIAGLPNTIVHDGHSFTCEIVNVDKTTA